MAMIEAEDLYAEWIRANGPVTPMTVVELIGWVLVKARHYETAGHRQTLLTDEAYLLKLGYVQERGGWHLPSG
jgi:hypothetical protein